MSMKLYAFILLFFTSQTIVAGKLGILIKFAELRQYRRQKANENAKLRTPLLRSRAEARQVQAILMIHHLTQLGMGQPEQMQRNRNRCSGEQ